MSNENHMTAALRQMFAAYNQPCPPERLAMYAEVLGTPEPEALEEAIRYAMRESGDFAPGPGTIHRNLRAVTRSRPGDPVGDWQFAGQRNERALPSGQAAAQLMDGLARRTPSMTEVFKRAKEIRAAGLVPPDIWGRFASEVMAELEMDPHAEVSAEMRRCMAHAREWREAKAC